MDSWSKGAFIFAGASLIAFGVRNLFWSLAREESRFRWIVSHGLAKLMLINGTINLTIGASVMYAAQSVPYFVIWSILGAIIAANGCFSIGVSQLSSVVTPTIEQTPGSESMRKQVTMRRLTGVLLTSTGLAWIFNGATSAV